MREDQTFRSPTYPYEQLRQRISIQLATISSIISVFYVNSWIINIFIWQVDFGSAVACERGDGLYELAGVNSWDIACQNKQPLPSVFATSDAQWINVVLGTPLPVLQAQEESFNQGLLKGEGLDGVDTEDKPGFSQGYGKWRACISLTFFNHAQMFWSLSPSQIYVPPS